MRFKVGLIFIILALVFGGVFYWHQADGIERSQAATASSDSLIPPGKRVEEGEAGTAAPAGSSEVQQRAVQVRVVSVRSSEVPVYISGLGTVQALYAIALKSQVDGTILRIGDEGSDVKIGDPVVTIDPTQFEAQLEMAQAKKTRAVAQLENAKANLWRDKELLKHDFATQRQTDAESMLVDQYTADIAQFDADIKWAQAQLDYATIRSPINGRLGIRNVDPGNLVRAGDNTVMITINQLQPISAIITVPAKELARNDITPGQTNLSVLAYAQNGVTMLGRGSVQVVNNAVDQSTGTIRLKASFANERYKLWPGDFIDCKIVVETRQNGLTLPSAAIRHGPRGDFTWVVRPDNTVEMRPVTVRQLVGDVALIDRGVESGEKVVLDGHLRLQVGSRVEILPQTERDRPEISSTE